jgi:hypothetical protein
MLNPDKQFSRGFTIMEMIVSIGILVVVILSVGVIFQNAGRTVGVSQSSMEMLSGVRAIQQQIENDVSGMDKNCFLVIRCATFGNGQRCDQISFVSRGSFSNRTGTAGAKGALMEDSATNAPAALIWWGQLAIQKQGGDNTQPTVPSAYLDADTYGYKVPLNQVPNGETDGDFILGRRPILLLPKQAAVDQSNPSGVIVPSYQEDGLQAAVDYTHSKPIAANAAESGALFDITQARIGAAQTTPSQLMATLMDTIKGNRSGKERFEADRYCYRPAALRSPYESSLGLINGFFRMHPVALQGVSSFAIDWTDGSVYQQTDVGASVNVATGEKVTLDQVNTTRWYGMYDATKSLTKTMSYDDPAVPTSVVDRGHTMSFKTVDEAHGDGYAAIFSYDNRVVNGNPVWPVALRFRYHVADPSGRLQHGRDFVEIVKLPD